MNSRAAAWFAVAVFFLFGAWASYEGWQMKWKAKGISWRLGGAIALVAAGFCAVAANRR
jgi:hypothetical protein